MERETESCQVLRACMNIHGQKTNIDSKAALTRNREGGWMGRGRTCLAVADVGLPTWRVRLRKSSFSGQELLPECQLSCAFSSGCMREVCLKAKAKPHLQVSACFGSWQVNKKAHCSAEALGEACTGYEAHQPGCDVLSLGHKCWEEGKSTSRCLEVGDSASAWTTLPIPVFSSPSQHLSDF